MHPFDNPLFARISLAHSVRPESGTDLSASFTTASLGGGLALRWPELRLNVEPRVSVILDHLRVSATDPQSGRTDTGTQLGLGAQLGTGLILETGRVCPVLGLEGYWLTAPTEILVRNQDVARVPALGFHVQLGARLFI